MKIFEFHNSARQLMNVGQAQYFQPEEIDLQLNNSISELYRQEYKHFEATQEISDTLGFYKTQTDPLVLDGNNQQDIPGTAHHVTGVEAILDDDSRVQVEVLTDGQWLGRAHSSAFGPSDDYPIARQIGTSKIEVLPSTVKSIVIFYLRKPATAKYDYTIDPSGTGWSFKQSTSVEVDWPSIGHPQIQDKMLVYLGVTLRDPSLVQNETIRKTQNEDR